MAGRFTVEELEVLRHAIEPKRIRELVYSVLDERYGFPEWIHKAIEHGWEPPYQWHKAERDRLGNILTSLIDRHWLTPGRDWHLVLSESLSEMVLIAEQASEPRQMKADSAAQGS
jgi:hypothetical protein